MRERIRGWLSPRTATWVAIGVWVLILLGVFGRVAFSRPEKGSVVPIYLTAGERWLAGESLYGMVPGLDLYRNPPGVAVLFAPLTFLGPKLAAILWRVVCLGVYAHGIRGLLRDVIPPLSPWRACGVWVLSAVLVIPAFNNGQINLLIVGTAVCGVSAAARGRWWEAAAWLAGCGWLKLYTFAVGLLACVAAPKQLSWRLAVCSALLFGVPFFCQHPQYVLDRHAEFVTETVADDRTEAELVRAPRDWTIVPRTWFGSSIPQGVALGVSLSAAVGFALRVWRHRGPAVFVLPLALGLVWLTLLGPRTETNTYSMLAPVGAMVSVGLRGVRWAGWTACGCLLFGIVRASVAGEGWFGELGVQAIGAAVMGVVAWVWSVRTSTGEKVSERNGRDLNPRYGVTVYGISSAASSAARAPFRVGEGREIGASGSPAGTSYHRPER